MKLKMNGVMKTKIEGASSFLDLLSFFLIKMSVAMSAIVMVISLLFFVAGSVTSVTGGWPFNPTVGKVILLVIATIVAIFLVGFLMSVAAQKIKSRRDGEEE